MLRVNTGQRLRPFSAAGPGRYKAAFRRTLQHDLVREHLEAFPENRWKLVDPTLQLGKQCVKQLRRSRSRHHTLLRKAARHMPDQSPRTRGGLAHTVTGPDADAAFALGNLVQEILLPRQRISLQNIDHKTNGISRIGADEVDVGVSVVDWLVHCRFTHFRSTLTFGQTSFNSPQCKQLATPLVYSHSSSITHPLRQCFLASYRKSREPPLVSQQASHLKLMGSRFILISFFLEDWADQGNPGRGGGGSTQACLLTCYRGVCIVKRDRRLRGVRGFFGFRVCLGCG